MRFLKQLNLNRRIANDPSLYVDTAHSNIVMGVKQSLLLPRGSNTDYPSSLINGMIRYNTDSNEVEVYQSNKWRSLRFKESTQITQQNLGAGDDANVYFGPLNSIYNPSNISSDISSNTVNNINQYGGQNIIVVVENVLQLFNTNYIVVQNPTIIGESYIGTTSSSVSSGKTIYFNTSLVGASPTCAVGNGSNTTITFATQTAIPFAVGSSIIVTGFRPTAFNGIFTVTGSSTSTVTYTNSYNGTSTQFGTISATGASAAIYPAINITGATVTGTHIAGGSTISSYTVDPTTDALLSITLNNNITGSISVNSSITIGEGTRTISDNSYWLQFSSPVPMGKPVTVLLGFDQ